MKEKLSKCVTWNDSDTVFRSTDSFELRKFVNALKNAKEFVELTMRDDFLLNQAENILRFRGY